MTQSAPQFFYGSFLLILPLLASHEAGGPFPERISARLVGFNENDNCDAAAALNRLLSALLFGIGVRPTGATAGQDAGVAQG